MVIIFTFLFISILIGFIADDPELFQLLIRFIYTNQLNLDALNLEKSWSVVLTNEIENVKQEIEFYFRLKLLTNIWLMRCRFLLTSTLPSCCPIRNQNLLATSCQVLQKLLNTVRKILSTGMESPVIHFRSFSIRCSSYILFNMRAAGSKEGAKIVLLDAEAITVLEKKLGEALYPNKPS